MTGGSTVAFSESNTAWRFAGLPALRYADSLASSAIGGSSHAEASRVVTIASEDDRKASHFCAASLFLLALLTTTPLVNMADAFWVFPGSTAMSQAKGTFVNELNVQMPVWSMASFPALKRLVSKSGVPAPSLSVGMVLPD